MDMSFQLYSARKFSLEDTLATIKRLGYKYVEGYGGLYSDAEGLRRLLDQNGLSMPTGHFGLDLLETPDEALRIAQTLGVKVVICPYIAPADRPTSTDEWTAFAERLAKLAHPFHDAGLQFGYHNHDFEFHPLTDGSYPMDRLLEVARNVACELDVAWVVRGKADPELFIEKWGHRLIALHVKDLAPAGQNRDEDGWADVGQGTLPWKTLLELTKRSTAAQYFVAEHDNPSDVERFARRTLEAIQSFGV